MTFNKNLFQRVFFFQNFRYPQSILLIRDLENFSIFFFRVMREFEKFSIFSPDDEVIEKFWIWAPNGEELQLIFVPDKKFRFPVQCSFLMKGLEKIFSNDLTDN